MAAIDELGQNLRLYQPPPLAATPITRHPLTRLTWLILVALLTVERNAVAQTPEEVQKQIDLVNKQKDLAKAEKELLDAQVALAAAQRTQSDQATQLADQVAAAKAATELANAQKAAADAQKAQSDASAAAFKASIGEVPASGFTGSVTAGAGTGDIEAALLAARAVKKATATIAAAVRAAAPGGGRIVALGVSEIPAFQNHVAYKTQLGIVRLALNSAITASQSAAPPEGVRTEAPGVPLLGGAGLVLDGVNKLLGYLRTDYTYAGVTVEASDLVALTEVTNLLAKGTPAYQVIVPAIFNAKAVVDAGAFLIADLTTLAATRQLAEGLAKKHDAEVDGLSKAAADEKDPAKKLLLQRDAQRRKALAEGLRGATALFDAWFTKLTTADDKGVVGLVTIAKERAIVDQLGGGAKLLAVKVQKAGGGYMTKKSLWSFFAGAPLYHMGGAAVTYALLDGTTGEVASAGVVPVYGGYVQSKDVAATLGK